MFFSKDCQLDKNILKIRNLVGRRKKGSLVIESLGAPDAKVLFSFFLFSITWLFVENVSKISSQPNNLCKVLCKY